MRMPTIGQFLVCGSAVLEVVEIDNDGFYSVEQNTKQMYWTCGLGYKPLPVTFQIPMRMAA